jgi:GntR family transcriptional regulator
MATDRAVTGAIRADAPEPLWVQAAEFIKREIESGSLKPGSRLPAERLLGEQLRISRVTVRKALGQLTEEGVLSSSHGRGWFVAAAVASPKEWPNTLESFTETARRMGLTASSRVLEAPTRPATIDEAESLSIAPGTPLFALERVRLLNGVPTAVDLTRVPADYLPARDSIDFTTMSFYAAATDAGLEIAGADSTIEAQEADARLAGHLEIAPGKSLLVMHQTAFDRTDRALFLSTIWYVGERYRLRTFFARSGHLL